MCAAEVTPGATALRLVPGLEAGAPPLRLERLAGGSVNDSWRVDTAQGRFVLRVDGPAWRRPGVDRAREQGLHAAAAGAGLAPRLLARAAGIQVCEYLEGRIWSEADFLQPAQLFRLGARLAQLHALEAAGEIGHFDPGGCAQQYVQLMSSELVAATGAGAVAAEVRAAAQQVADGTAGECIIHGDLAHSNLLDGTRLWLLDWEYAQLADPLYDVACVLAYYPETRAQARRLLNAAGLAGFGQPGRLDAAIRVYEGLSWLWHQARRAAAAAVAMP